MADFFFRYTIILSITFLFCTSSFGADKPDFDSDALNSALKQSQADHNKTRGEISKHRKFRATSSTKTGRRKVRLHVADQYHGPDTEASMGTRGSSLLGLGEGKNSLLLDNTDVDIDRELEQVKLDPDEEKNK